MTRGCQVYDGVALPVDIDGIEKHIVVNTETTELGRNAGEFYTKEELSSMGIYDHSEEEELSDLWANAYIEADEADESSEYGGPDGEEYVTDEAHDDDYTWLEVDEGVFRRVSVQDQSPSHDQEEEPPDMATTGFFIDDFSDYDVEDEDHEKRLDIEEMEDRDWTIGSELDHHAQARPSNLSVDGLLSLPFDAALARLPSLRAHIEESSLTDESSEAMMENFRTNWSRDAPEDLWKVLEEIISESIGSVPNVEINDVGDDEDDKHARTSSIGDEYNVDWAKL